MKYYITANDKTNGYDDEKAFLAALEVCLTFGKKVLVTVAKQVSDVCVRINDIFKRHGFQVAIHIQSDPTAMDYVANAFVGGAVGGGLGAVAGGVTWSLAKYGAGILVPGLGQFLLVGAAVGGALGMIGGVVVTRWGLTARISPWNPDNIDIELTQISSHANA